MSDKKQKEDIAEAHVEVADDIDQELEALLQTDPSKGLHSEDVRIRLEQWGPNGK
jgi:hypothetical protein